MTVQNIISLAQVGELRQLAVKDDTEAIIGFINLGLLELYKRFNIRIDEAIITLQDTKTIYALDGTDVDVDMPDDNFMLVVGATGEAESGIWEDLPINDSGNAYSVNTVDFNKVQIPIATAGSLVSIAYLAKPNPVYSDNLADEIDLPEQLIEPLLNYIGYRGHGSIDGNIQTESNTHYMRFEASCNKARELGVAVTADTMSMANRISSRCFV